jgi:hypothetical protein
MRMTAFEPHHNLCHHLLCAHQGRTACTLEVLEGSGREELRSVWRYLSRFPSVAPNSRLLWVMEH